MTHAEEPWFKHAVLYQIYPRSFYDSNGDGIGDLQGVIEKLDYLNGRPDSLGVTAIWLSPFYPSPMADFGYDVTDHCDVHPMFGTLHDFKQLLKEAHARGIRVLIDFIPNHTSDEHAWFKESRASRDNPKRDWYIWRDAKTDGSLPNNWESVFGGPAWQYDKTTGQYYLHSFLRKQPDLNWDNPEVRKAMHEQMRFWLDLGVDGFRMDAVLYISKDPEYRDDPVEALSDFKKDQLAAQWNARSQNGPHLYEYLRGMAEVARQYPHKFIVTEAYPHPWDKVAGYVRFYENVDPRVCAPFNFEAIMADWNAAEFRHIIDNFQHALELEYMPVYCLGNHDRHRLATRLGSQAAARSAALLLLTLPGMPTLYYGDELGMIDGKILPEQVQDPYEKNLPGHGYGRDPARTPLPWNDSKHAGFTTGQPWLPINADHAHVNVAAENTDPESMLNLYRKLLAFRRQSPALEDGEYHGLETPEDVFGFRRVSEDEKLIVLVNFVNRTIELPEKFQQADPVISTHDGPLPAAITSLRPHEAVILREV